MTTQQLTTGRETRAAARVLLSARGLCMSFDGQQVLNGVDLDLHKGQVVLLRGPNGSGKTTLVNILTGYLTPDKGEIRLLTNGVEEDFVFPRRWWQDLNPWDHFLPERVAREGVCRSWQDTRLFQSVRLVDNVAVSDSRNSSENPLNVLFRPALSRRAETATVRKAIETLTGLGLNGRSNSSADKVSLGQSKRVAIARATGTGARILFLDEPLAGLDGPGIQSVVDLLKRLVDQHRMALVLVEHVSSVHYLQPLVDTIWDLSEGRLRETRKADPSNDNPSTKSNIGLLRLVSDMALAERRALPGGAALDIFRVSGKEATKPVLEIEDLVVHRGHRLVIGVNREEGDGIAGISIVLRAGDLAVLQAPNGWGKTTLLDAITGLVSVKQGVIRLAGEDITSHSPWKRSAQGLRYLRSNSKGFGNLNVGEVLRISGHGVSEYLSRTPDSRYGQLSGGEKRLVQFQAMQLDQAYIYLLDEPFSALDEWHVENIAEAIHAVVVRQRMAVLISLPTIGAHTQILKGGNAS